MRHRLEYAPVWLLVRILGLVPRRLARAAGIALGQTVRLLHRRLSRVAMRNLELAFPEMTPAERQ
ncbi:MAG TPA: lipid A biosynthesis acyltransferase, partial [Candidatus Binatia bacterium]|nr:lipid A biosynthesis acyltransferase [Candidatus Binatia bacterium]